MCICCTCQAVLLWDPGFFTSLFWQNARSPCWTFCLSQLTPTTDAFAFTVQKLQQLDLSFNGLEGPLPSSWSNIVALHA
jgi:hypothetical protein